MSIVTVSLDVLAPILVVVIKTHLNEVTVVTSSQSVDSQDTDSQSSLATDHDAVQRTAGRGLANSEWQHVSLCEQEVLSLGK